jgi:bud site selection protein 20
MGGIQKHRASSAKNKAGHRSRKTKHYSRDHDQIHDDMKKPEKFEELVVDETKPGAGQFYCVSCARFFES